MSENQIEELIVPLDEFYEQADPYERDLIIKAVGSLSYLYTTFIFNKIVEVYDQTGVMYPNIRDHKPLMDNVVQSLKAIDLTQVYNQALNNRMLRVSLEQFSQMFLNVTWALFIHTYSYIAGVVRLDKDKKDVTDLVIRPVIVNGRQSYKSLVIGIRYEWVLSTSLATLPRTRIYGNSAN